MTTKTRSLGLYLPAGSLLLPGCSPGSQTIKSRVWFILLSSAGFPPPYELQAQARPILARSSLDIKGS